jgi:hypothetical protein
MILAPDWVSTCAGVAEADREVLSLELMPLILGSFGGISGITAHLKPMEHKRLAHKTQKSHPFRLNKVIKREIIMGYCQSEHQQSLNFDLALRQHKD